MSKTDLAAVLHDRLRRWHRPFRWGLVVGLLLTLTSRHGPYAQTLPDGPDGSPARPALAPTAHPPVSSELSQLWLVPGRRARDASDAGLLEELARGIKAETDSRYPAALAVLDRPVLQRTPLADYATYYAGLAEVGLKQIDRARKTFAALAARQPSGYLAEAAPLAEAQAAEAANDNAAALAIYEQLLQQSPTHPEEVLLRMGRAAARAGDVSQAADALRRVYFDYPLTEEADEAGKDLAGLRGAPALADAVSRRLELARAGTLFKAGRFQEARDAYAAMLPRAMGEDREGVLIRLAACDVRLRHYAFAREDAQPYVERGSHQAEATYYYAAALRGLHRGDEYVTTVRGMVGRFGDNPWVESALNDLGTYYIIENDDDDATTVFRQMLDRFPTGAHAERAAWKVGWAEYRQGLYGQTARVFDAAAAQFPRSDYRPAYLYWAGRAYEALKAQPLADARFALTATDYLNSYYGRRAVDRLGGQAAWQRVSGDTAGLRAESADLVSDLPRTLPPTGTTIQALLAVGLYAQAMQELHYARRAWGPSPAIEATVGWVRNREGHLREGINAMKRAYPQYLAASGEQLPRAILEVLFPLDYWPLIRRYAAAHNLDPYLMAALIAQESTFEPAIRSSADAIGLMQLLPSTGRHYARVLRVGRFSTRMLTAPAVNIRLGMAYFSDLVERFGGVHFALAGYNAGESRVSQWIQERGGLNLDRDEFVEDIPYPETQNYIKRILGTADDYRWLYGGRHEASAMAASAANERDVEKATVKAERRREEARRDALLRERRVMRKPVRRVHRPVRPRKGPVRHHHR